MAPRSESDVSFAKITLPYPIFAVEFDPYNRDYLVVGGGGGESKTGVPNQISVLDVSNRSEITVAAELPLSRDEDSVQSLASLATREGLITFAGINSSQSQQNAGKNEHLRSFEIAYPPRKKQRTEKDGDSETGVIKALGKSSLFQTSSAAKKETYQRLLRLSPPSISGESSKRIGAIATGLAKDSELIVFSATKQVIEKADVLTRITPLSEVADLDIIDTGKSEYSLVYCTDTDIYEQTLKYDFDKKKLERTPKAPRNVQSLDSLDVADPGGRPKLRSIRFLTPDHVLVLANRSNKGGAELRVYHLYPDKLAFQLQEKSLPSRMKQATSMDVCVFDEDADGNQQIAVAVAGQDISIELYTLNYKGRSNTFSSFRSYISMKNVHEHQMTKICFSPFHTPSRTTVSKAKRSAIYLRLASVSYGNTVVIDSIPLKALDESDRKSRYVLSHPTDERFNTFLWFGLGSLLITLLAFVLYPSLTPSRLHKAKDVPAVHTSVHHASQHGISHEYSVLAQVEKSASSVVAEGVPTRIPGRGRLLDMIDKHLHLKTHDHSHGDASPPQDVHKQDHTDAEAAPQPDASKAVVVRLDDEGDGVSVHVHHDKEELLKEDTEARHWHELEEHEKVTWRRRLIKAGQWAEGQSEKVLMGVLFSEYAGMVGQALG